MLMPRKTSYGHDHRGHRFQWKQQNEQQGHAAAHLESLEQEGV
jgi:hypothetical protein